MSEVFVVILSFVMGSGIGVFFFAGLWWTVRKVAAPNSSPFRFVGSWIFRMTVSLFGFYEVTVLFPGKHGFLFLLASVLGFIAARFGVNRLVQRGESCT